MYDYITSECLSFWSAHLYGCCCLVVKSFPTPWTVAQQAPLSMGFSKKDYWSGLSFPSPAEWRWGGGVSSQPRDQTSPALAGGFFTIETPEKPHLYGAYMPAIFL